MTAPNLWIQATVPSGAKIGFGLAGDSKLSRSGGSGAGGWQIIDRPRRAATTEWVDYGPFEMQISLILDGWGTARNPSSIEAQIAVVESWEAPAPGSAPPLPPILKITGPVPHTELDWVAQTVNWGEAIRDPVSGVRYQQNVDLVLWQYLPATIVSQAAKPVPASTPAAAARAAAASTTGSPSRTYTVKNGQTLLTIATQIYGSWPYWTLLANANGIRTSGTLTAGLVLTVPAKTATPPALNPVGTQRG